MLALWMTLLGCPSTDDVNPTGDPAECAGVDEDGDGSTACSDCDDNNPDVFPGAPERCNGVDDDCDDALLDNEVDPAACEACDAAGYWLSTRDLTGTQLKTELRSLTTPIDCGDYSANTDYLYLELDKIDGMVECVYTGRTVAVGNTKPDGNDMNTEHTWPQGFGADVLPRRCDLNHLFPTDSNANNRRGSYPFGEVTGSTDWSEGGSVLGNDSSGDTVFEPRDLQKGNTARAMLYFELLYSDVLVPSDIDAMMEGRRALFARWSADDPPTGRDQERALQIADRMGGANPFEVCPELVDRL